jgi:NTP pyrophosphatase (non-canonical NTP hydrolase)
VNDLEFESMVRDELARARCKFPDQGALTLMAAAIEEVGETSQAILQGQGPKRVREEAAQVAVMAFRIALDCDLEPPSPRVVEGDCDNCA